MEKGLSFVADTAPVVDPVVMEAAQPQSELGPNVDHILEMVLRQAGVDQAAFSSQ